MRIALPSDELFNRIGDEQPFGALPISRAINVFDRADALVWAMTYLMQAMLGGRARIGQL